MSLIIYTEKGVMDKMIAFEILTCRVDLHVKRAALVHSTHVGGRHVRGNDHVVQGTMFHPSHVTNRECES